MFSNTQNSKRVGTSPSSSSPDNNHPPNKLPKLSQLQQEENKKNSSSQLQNRSFQQVQSLQNVYVSNPVLQHSSLQHSSLQHSSLQHSSLQHSSLQHSSLQSSTSPHLPSPHLPLHQHNNLLKPSPLTCAKANQWNLGARQFEKTLQPQLGPPTVRTPQLQPQQRKQPLKPKKTTTTTTTAHNLVTKTQNTPEINPMTEQTPEQNVIITDVLCTTQHPLQQPNLHKNLDTHRAVHPKKLKSSLQSKTTSKLDNNPTKNNAKNHNTTIFTSNNTVTTKSPSNLTANEINTASPQTATLQKTTTTTMQTATTTPQHNKKKVVSTSPTAQLLQEAIESQNNSSSVVNNSNNSSRQSQQQLALLAKNFVMYLSKHKKSGDTFTISDTMESLSPSGFDYERKDSTQRRLYDIINILEGLGWAKRDPKQKKTYTWLGDDDFIDGLKKSRGKPSEMHNYRPIQPIDGYTKIDQSLPTLTKNFIGLLFCSHELEIDLDTVALTLLPSDDKKCQTKLRRFYDIANVLDGLNLIEKAGKKKCYRWTYERESLLSLQKAVDDSLDLGDSEHSENANISDGNCVNKEANQILQPKFSPKQGNTTTPKYSKPNNSCPDSGIAVTPKETNHSTCLDSTPIRPRKNSDGQNKPDVRSKMDILLQVSADLLSTPRKTHELNSGLGTTDNSFQSYNFLNDSKQTLEFTTPPPKISPKMHKLIQTSPWLLDELINARIREREKQNQENTATPESGKNSDKKENVRRNLQLDFN